MKNNFQSKTYPQGSRTLWRYLSALILLFSLGIGQMWGEVVGKNTSTTGTIIYSNINSTGNNVNLTAGTEENGFNAISGASFKSGPGVISVAENGYFALCVDDITEGTVYHTMTVTSNVPDWTSTSGGSNGRYAQLYIGDTGAKKYLYTKYSTNTTVEEATGLTKEGSNVRGIYSFSFTSSDLTTIGTKKYLKFKALGGEYKPAGFKIVAASGSGSDPIKVTSVAVTAPANNAEYHVGEQVTLAATVLPANATNKTLNWTMDVNDKATISDGKITFTGAGDFHLTATAADGSNKSNTVHLYVTSAPAPSYCAELYPATSGETIAVGDVIDMQAGSNGGKMTAISGEANCTLAYNAYGLSFASSGTTSRVNVELNHLLKVGSNITVTLVANGNGNDRGLELYNAAGTKKALLGWLSAESVTSGSEKSFTYTVVAGDGIVGTNNFKLYRKNSVYLKSLKVSNCGAEIIPVTFNVQGHGVAPATQYLSSGDKIAEPLEPDADNYRFEGWYKESACTNAWNFATETVSGATELFAKWVAVDCSGTGTLFSITSINPSASQKVAKTSDSSKPTWMNLSTYATITGGRAKDGNKDTGNDRGGVNGGRIVWDSGNAVLWIHVDCPVAEGDVLSVSGLSGSLYVQKGYSDTEGRLSLTSSDPAVTEVELTAAFDGLKDIYIWRNSGTTYVTGVTIARPAPACAATAPGDITKGTLTSGSITLTAGGTKADGDTWYWQSSATGEDKTGTSGASKTVSAAGTYYIRSFNTTGNCWSDAKSYKLTAEDFMADPEAEFNDGEYTIGGDALALISLFSSYNTNDVTFALKEESEFASVTAGAFTATKPGSYVITATQAASASYQAVAEEATITVSYPVEGNATITFALSGAKTTTGTVSGVSSISGLSTEFTLSTLAMADSKSGYSGKITGTAEVTELQENTYADVQFTVADGYMFTPSAVTVRVNPFNETGALKAVVKVMDAQPLEVASNELTCAKSTDNEIVFASGAFKNKNFRGTVHLRMYFYGPKNSKVFHIKSPITISGTVAEECNNPDNTLALVATPATAIYEGDEIAFSTTGGNGGAVSIVGTASESITEGKWIATLGEHTFTASQAKNAGYCAQDAELVLNVLEATPVVEVTVSGKAAEYIGNEVILTATAEYATQYEWYVDGTKQGSDSAKLHFTPSEEKTYNIVCKAKNKFNSGWIASDAHSLVATKLCGDLVQIVLTGDKDGTVSGKVSGTKDVGAQNSTETYETHVGYKLGADDQFIGIKELAYPLRAADTVIVYVTKESANLLLYSDKGNTKIGEKIGGVVKGENKIVLNKAATGKTGIYLYRVKASKDPKGDGNMNPYVYSIAVKRPCEKSNDANISLLTINGDTVAPVNKVYNYEVAYSVDLSKVAVAYDIHPWAISTQESSFDINVPAVGDPANTQNIVVTAEDGTTQETYTVNVAKAAAANTDASLKSLSVTGYTLDPVFAAETTTYSISRAFNVQNPAKSAIKATANDKYAKSVVIDSLGAYYTVTVTAEDNFTTQVYTINVNVTEAEKSLSKVEFSNGFNAFIDNTNRTVKAYYMAGTDTPTATTITADKGTAGELSEGKIRVTGSDDSFVDYIVTLEAVDPMTSYDKQTFDGSENYVKAGLDYDGCWKFRKNATSDDREQKGYTRMYFFVGGGADKATFTSAQSKRAVKIYVNNVLTDVEETASSGSTFDVPLDPNVANNMIAIISNQTSGDGGVSAVKLNEHVTSSDASLKSLTVNSNAIDLASGELVAGVMTYKYELPYGTTAVPVVAAEANDDYATMGAITQAASATGTATFTVTAEDATAQEYAVQFSVARFPTIVIWDGSTMSDIATSPTSENELRWAKTGISGTSFSAKTCEENGKSYTKALDFGGKTSASRQFSIIVPDGYVAKVSLVYRAKGTGRSIMIGSALSDAVDANTISSVEAVDNEKLYVFTSLFNGGTLYINTTDGFHVHEISVLLAPGHSRMAMLGAGVLGTVCVPNNVAIEDIQGVTVYELMGRDYTNYGKLAFDEIISGELVAGKPYLFEAHGNHMALVYGNTHVDEPVDAGNGMYGTFEQVVFSGDQLSGIYYFAQRALWSCDGAETLTIPANRAYVKLSEIGEVPSSTPAPGRRRVLMAVNGKNTPTGMDAINASEKPMKLMINGQIFILRGEMMYDATGRLVK